MIRLHADDQTLTVEQSELLVSGSVNVYQVQFSFSDRWEELDKTAVFQAWYHSWSVPLDGDTCSIPWEALKKPGCVLRAGVYGTKGDQLILPTLWAEVGKIEPGAAPGDDTKPPTPGVYEQILAEANQARQLAQSVRDDADGGVFNGASAYQQAVGAGMGATEAEFTSALVRTVDAFGDPGLTDDERADPDAIYEKTRPLDWMKLPELEDVNDGEVWLLFQWSQGTTRTATFTVAATNGFTVDVGRYENGVYTPDPDYHQDLTGSSSQTVTLTLNAADFGDVTSMGNVQAVVRFVGNLTQVAPSAAGGDRNPYVDCIVKGENLTSFAVSRENVPSNIRYVAVLGQSQITSISGTYNAAGGYRNSPNLLCIRGDGAFYGSVINAAEAFLTCPSLLAIPKDMALPYLQNGSKMFYGCYSLQALPAGMMLEELTNGSMMFCFCYSIQALPAWMTLGKLTSGSEMFRYIYGVREIGLDCPLLTNLSNMFNNSLFSRIGPVYAPLCTNMSGAFTGCQLLEELWFDARMTTWASPQDLVLSSCNFALSGIVKLFNSLPIITIAKSVNLTGNPGASELTEEIKAIATQKGWTVVA